MVDIAMHGPPSNKNMLNKNYVIVWIDMLIWCLGNYKKEEKQYKKNEGKIDVFK